MIKIPHRLSCSKGQTLVETAFALLLFFLLVLGIFEFGRAMYLKNTLTNAARSGARAAVVSSPINNGDSTTLPKNCSTSYSSSSTGHDAVYYAVCNSLFSIPSNQVTVTITDSTNSPAISGDSIQVNVTWSGFAPITPLFSKIIGKGLQSNATMRYE